MLPLLHKLGSYSTISSQRVPTSLYQLPTLELAIELLGKRLVTKFDSTVVSGRIVEVEAYIGEDDPACHAASGKTDRNEVMYGQPGFIYVYFIYGMYYCLNFVTEDEGFPAAILIRAAEPLSTAHDPLCMGGPGKLCRQFRLDRSHNGISLAGDTIWLEQVKEPPRRVSCSTRIGIRKATTRRWRFYNPDSPAVSAHRNANKTATYNERMKLAELVSKDR